ncbi:MAG: iron-sulfur cluster assembly scaffold protein [Alphaproteobacteria bacterium]|nr:MAG: iron-sulfur cluster assembly scaffold protein [Alphaproteobacteria bacterium]
MANAPEPISELYSRRILQLAGSISHTERLKDPEATVTVSSPLCGSRVTVDLKMDGDVITDFAHEVKACALGQTSSAVMAEHVVGATRDEIHEVAAQMRAMLKEGGEPPTGKWADLEVLQPVRDYKSRHASVMLTFDAVEKAMAEINEKKKETSKE